VREVEPVEEQDYWEVDEDGCVVGHNWGVGFPALLSWNREGELGRSD
jgi:hypothetical protein